MQNVNRVEELPSNTVSATKRIRYKDIIREVRSLGVPPHMKGYRCYRVSARYYHTLRYGHEGDISEYSNEE